MVKLFAVDARQITVAANINWPARGRVFRTLAREGQKKKKKQMCDPNPAQWTAHNRRIGSDLVVTTTATILEQQELSLHGPA